MAPVVSLSEADLEEEIRTREALIQSLDPNLPLARSKRETFENELLALRHELSGLRSSQEGEESDFPVSPPTRRTLLPSQSSQMNSQSFHGANHDEFSDANHLDLEPGFTTYAGNQNAFTQLPSLDERSLNVTPRSVASSADNSSSWNFQGLRPKSNVRDDLLATDISTSAESSSGSALTPPSVRGSPALPLMQSYRTLKRGRESFGAIPQASKTLRTTPSPGTTRPETPTSIGSFDSADITDDVRRVVGGDFRDQYTRTKEQEERAERERLDAEYARGLEAELNGYQNLSQHPQMFVNSSPNSHKLQPYLDTPGDYGRRERNISEQPGPSYLSTTQTPLSPATPSLIQQISHGSAPVASPSSSFRDDQAGMQSQVNNELSSDKNPNVRLPSIRSSGLMSLHQLDRDTDEDVTITDGSEFIPNDRKYFAAFQEPQQNIHFRPETNASLPPVVDNNSVIDFTGSSPLGHGFCNPTLPEFNTFVPDIIEPGEYDQALAPVNDSLFGNLSQGISSAASAMYDFFGSHSSLLPALPSFPSGHASNVWGSGAGTSNNPYTLDDDNADTSNSLNGNLFGSSTDTNKTTDELRDLMNNIRPDEELGASDRTGSPEDMAEGCALYEHQKLGVAWMSSMEEGASKGGILADDMGLGKTIQAIALMVSRRSQDPGCKTNLIITPVALLNQWENEIKIKVRPDRRLTTYVYHGSKQSGKTWGFLRNFDVVLTTYGVLASEMKRKEGIDYQKNANPNWKPTSLKDYLPLLGSDSKFYRVILDEAQNIKNARTKSALATYLVQSKLRFCMTGTPMMNNVGELFSLVRFLRIRPYCEWEKFNSDFIRPLRGENLGNTDTALQKFRAFLKAVLLRRTKKSQINGKPILTLPERFTIVDHAVMDEHQREFYIGLEQKYMNKFNRYMAAGTIGHNISNALVLLLRLRQACCHPHLIREYGQPPGIAELSPEELERIAQELSPETVRRIKEEGVIDCPICMDIAENSTIFIPCGHRTCSECFVRISDPSQMTEDAASMDGKVFKCMTCRGSVNPKKITDWKSFQKVYMPELAAREEIQSSRASADADNQSDEGVISDLDSSSDSDSDSDSNEDFESDSQSSLGDFIVDDDETEGGGSTTDEDAKSEEIASANRLSESIQPISDVKKGKQPMRNTGKKKTKKRKANKREKLKKDVGKTLSELQKEANRNQQARKLYMKRLRKQWVSSCKVDKCMEILEEIMSRKENEKTIVFSQFTTMLDLLEIPLSDRNWTYKRYDGGMGPTARNKAVIEFTTKRNCKIMLVSLKAGNSGLNLTAANNIVVFDPFWNPYIEEQAVDRAHRIGQRRTVQVHRLLVQDTVEDRIIQLQDKKRAMIEGALDEKASRNIARLGVRELAFLFGVSGQP